jgi:hypothetical protein
MKKIITTSLLAALGALFAGSVQAQQVYIGGTVGESFWNVDCSGTTDCSKYHSNYKAILGYTFNSSWAIEASYFSVGETTANIGEISGGVKATGIDLGGVYRVDLGNKWGAFAKLGVSDNRAQVTAVETDVAQTSVETKKAGAFGGLGVTYALTRDASFRADVDARRIEVDATTGSSSGNVYSINIGLQVAF